MISEGSCDTYDWSNDAENTALSSQEKNILCLWGLEISYNKHTVY